MSYLTIGEETAGPIYPRSGKRLPGLIKDMDLVVSDGGPHAVAWPYANQVDRALLGFLT